MTPAKLQTSPDEPRWDRGSLNENHGTITGRLQKALVAMALLTSAVAWSAPQPHLTALYDVNEGAEVGTYERPRLGADGVLYGIGRGSGDGAVWRVKTNGTGFAELRRFSRSTDGALPIEPPVLGPDGRLYGTNTEDANYFLGGTVWRMNADGSGFRLLRHFAPDADENYPEGWDLGEVLFGPDGALYGLAGNGGKHGGGTAWRMKPDGSRFTVLRHFEWAPNGAYPRSPVFLPDSRLYGLSDDFLWQMSSDGTGFKRVLPLREGPLAGRKAWRMTFGRDGFFYAISRSEAGSSVQGDLIWRVRCDGSGLQALKAFDASVKLPGAPVLGPDGRLYGTATIDKGPFEIEDHMVWRMNDDGSAFVVLERSAGGATALDLDRAGKVYFTTNAGAKYGEGAIYAWGNAAPTSTFTATPQPATPGVPVTFDASASSDPNADGLVYLWDFGDGTTTTASPDASTVTHAYASAGSYKARLQVIDSYGASSKPAERHIRISGSSGAAVLQNGSFESGAHNWVASGNVRTVGSPPYRASEGAKLLVFNDGEKTPNGSVAQTWRTTPGRAYVIEFDAGVLAYNRREQRLQVTVSGKNGLASRVVTITGAGGGTIRWQSERVSFTADDDSATVTFRDVSTTTTSIDLLLDNVRLTSSLSNGSFEAGTAGWTAKGNLSIATPKNFAPTDGAALARFNEGNTSPNGSLVQAFATVPGRQYRLTFDAGVLAFNQKEQRLQVVVAGEETVLSHTLSLVGAGGGQAKWMTRSFVFTANSATSTLTFRDVSPATDSLDLLLDNVRIE